jgi:protein O-GlcNAc transferase
VGSRSDAGIEDDAEAMNQMGVVLAGEERADEAIAAFRNALEQRPGWAEPLINIGNMLRNHRRSDEGIAAYLEAIALEPGNVDAHHLVASALGRHGLREASRAHYLEALRLDPMDAVIHSSLLYLTGYDPDIEPAVMLNEHIWWDRLHGLGMTALAPHANDRNPDRKLRVGYVSPDFRTHPVARFMLPIYEAHDHSQFEVYSYAQLHKPDGISERFRAHSDGWRTTLGLTDARIVEMIRADEIDILVDLGGHTGRNRISMFSWQGAPVQASYLGYPNTTGLKTIQYRITDAINDPPEERSHYTEQLVRLPGPWCCWEPQASPDVTAAPCVASGFVTFGSMMNLLKINDGVVDLWAKVLDAVPGSRLLIYRNTFNGMARDYFRKKFIDRGITPDRFEMITAAQDGMGHLQEYSKIDISLDAHPWSGHTTTCESLWMGAPLLTLRGSRPSGRMSASVLAAVGLSEFIAETPGQFVEIAAKVAGDPQGLANRRGGLREQVRRSPLCNGKVFTQGLEAAYREIWRRWCASPTS